MITEYNIADMNSIPQCNNNTDILPNTSGIPTNACMTTDYSVTGHVLLINDQ